MRVVPHGLRGRLVLAFVAASAITLAVVAAVMLSPLQTQLREQSVENLEQAVVGARAEFDAALGDRAVIFDVAFDLRQQTDARILVDYDDDGTTLPEVWYDSEAFTPRTEAVLATLQALREERLVTRIDGDQVTVATRLFSRPGGVLVAQRRLTEVVTTVEQVRRALFAAAGVGLAVAVLLAVMLSGTLLRRLARLRAAARRIAEEGPDAPAPRDTGRDEVGDLARALARMQEELRRQEAARRSFVATASHELRTPLTMLQGTMELLEEDLRDGRLDIEDAQLQVTNARRELLRLSALAGELLDLSRLDAAVQLRSEPVELGEIARAVAAEFDLRAHDLGTEISVRPPLEGCWGRGDPDAVARVVRILLDNALRYGPPRGTVTLRTANAGGRASLEVADEGPGIPAEERERVFERFHRGRSAASASGFGLGLAIGRELAERMGGTLQFAERGEPGGCFVLTLPSADAEAAAGRAQARALT